MSTAKEIYSLTCYLPPHATLTELNAIASPAIHGASKPAAATGISAVLIMILVKNLGGSMISFVYHGSLTYNWVI